MKLKIGFEITDNYTRQEFKNLILKLKDQPDFFYPCLEVELFLLSTNPDVVYINRIGSNLKLDANHVFSFNSTDSKILKIEELGLDIYFTNLQLEFIKIDVTKTHPILVNNIYDRYANAYKYLVKFDETLKRILNEKTN